jgi:hypothetical protein
MTRDREHASGAARRPNKGMKQTSVERIGRSQLIPGVLRTGGSGGHLTAGLQNRTGTSTIHGMDTWPASRRNALRQALLETIEWLRRSDDSAYADPVSNLIECLAGHLRRIEADEAVDRQHLSLLFAPTGQLQETSIDNGWGAVFLRLAEAVDASLPLDNAGPDE